MVSSPNIRSSTRGGLTIASGSPHQVRWRPADHHTHSLTPGPACGHACGPSSCPSCFLSCSPSCSPSSWIPWGSRLFLSFFFYLLPFAWLVLALMGPHGQIQFFCIFSSLMKRRKPSSGVLALPIFFITGLWPFYGPRKSPGSFLALAGPFHFIFFRFYRIIFSRLMAA